MARCYTRPGAGAGPLCPQADGEPGGERLLLHALHSAAAGGGGRGGRRDLPGGALACRGGRCVRVRYRSAGGLWRSPVLLASLAAQFTRAGAVPCWRLWQFWLGSSQGVLGQCSPELPPAPWRMRALAASRAPNANPSLPLLPLPAPASVPGRPRGQLGAARRKHGGWWVAGVCRGFPQILTRCWQSHQIANAQLVYLLRAAPSRHTPGPLPLRIKLGAWNSRSEFRQHSS